MAGDSKYNVARLLIIGLVFHCIFILAVFDTYFTSPVVHGMESYSLGTAEAKRLVLIVGDGLRADLVFSVNAFPSIPDAPEVVAPYIRSIVETRGAFGVSHTRVPTESRPGHVALIGGMYEDVSAVTKGWKTNPVDFDSVFNQSSYTFSFGSPDILPMFARGATPGKVKTWSYNEDEEDFTKDATALDVWVLEQLRALLRNATVDTALNSQLRSDRVVFFLHLLGLDTTGHSYRPHSKEYMNNIQVVDDIVRQTESLFTDFFQDEETSFIFSADHGMSDIGNHGDGNPDNTRTPLIAWGRGIRGPLPDSFPSSHDSYSEPWRLGNLLRLDVEQADIASLMAALIGINWPVNSVGVLPDVDPNCPGYLLPRNGDETRAHAAFVNVKVILEQYRVKHELKQAHTLFYRPFADLERMSSVSNTSRFTQIADIEGLLENQEWYNARQKSAKLIKTALEGLRYLQTYDRWLIRTIVITAYTGWAAYASLFIFRPQTDLGQPHNSYFITLTAVLILSAFWGLFAIQRSPWTFYLYIAFPIIFWQQFLLHALPFLRTWLFSQCPGRSYSTLAFRAGLILTTLQCMVAAYTHRPIWSVGLVLMGVVWPIISWPKATLYERRMLYLCWAISCLVTGVFPLLGVEKRESLPTIIFGGATMIVAGVTSAAAILQTVKTGKEKKGWSLPASFVTQLVFILLAMLITTSSTLKLQAKAGLPLLNQISGWIVLTVASLFPFVSRTRHPNACSKLLMFFLGFGPCFVILSISVEGLFYLAYAANLVIWIEVEAAIRFTQSSSHKKNVYSFQGDDTRIALFFLFFVQMGFFGTGNVASISSFYLEPVYRLVPIFNPFLMAALLVFKIIAPYVILSVTFATLNFRLHLPPFSLFLVALTLTDVMTMTFFFNVRDTGSWLEIGQSISFFCITSLLLVWSAGICSAGEFLMADTLRAMSLAIQKSD